MVRTEHSKKRRLTIVYLAVTVIMLLGTILPFALPRQDLVSGNGTITHVNLEGGFYGIIADGGIQYEPANLDASFAQDNMRVSFQGKIRTDIVNVHQWGSMLELTKLEKLP
jgi:hypothetical protein